MDGTTKCEVYFSRPTNTGPFSEFPGVSPSCVVLFFGVVSASSTEIYPGAGIDFAGNSASFAFGREPVCVYCGESTSSVASSFVLSSDLSVLAVCGSGSLFRENVVYTAGLLIFEENFA